MLVSLFIVELPPWKVGGGLSSGWYEGECGVRAVHVMTKWMQKKKMRCCCPRRFQSLTCLSALQHGPSRQKATAVQHFLIINPPLSTLITKFTFCTIPGCFFFSLFYSLNLSFFLFFFWLRTLFIPVPKGQDISCGNILTGNITFLCVLPGACDDTLSTWPWLYIPGKVEERGYGCRVNALSSPTLFIDHTHVASGFLFSLYEVGESTYVSTCVRGCVCAGISFRFAHFPAPSNHQSPDETQEHRGNCAITLVSEGKSIMQMTLHLCVCQH